MVEVERRLDHFEWFVHMARRPTGIQSFVLDLATAYLLSLESALQVLKKELARSLFDAWLAGTPANSLVFRGLRTMRHLEAHIRSSTLDQRAVGGHSRFTAGEGGSNLGWRWGRISDTDFALLDRPRITAAELPAWNAVLEDRLIMDLMRDSIAALVQVFDEAER